MNQAADPLSLMKPDPNLAARQVMSPPEGVQAPAEQAQPSKPGQGPPGFAKAMTGVFGGLFGKQAIDETIQRNQRIQQVLKGMEDGTITPEYGQELLGDLVGKSKPAKEALSKMGALQKVMGVLGQLAMPAPRFEKLQEAKAQAGAAETGQQYELEKIKTTQSAMAERERIAREAELEALDAPQTLRAKQRDQEAAARLQAEGTERDIAKARALHPLELEKIQAGIRPSYAPAQFRMKDGSMVSGFTDRDTMTYYDSLRRPIAGDQVAEVNPPSSQASEDRDTAFQAYADSVGKPAGALTAEDKLKAIQKFKEDTTPEDIKLSRQFAQDAAQQRLADNAEKKDNIKLIAQGIIDGHQPPDLMRLYGMAGAVRAELERRGYDLKTATADWLGMQTYMRSMNSTQQLRLQQATLFTRESLDLVDQLVDDLRGKIPRGRVSILNKASMVAAMNGAYGAEPQQIASNLDIQIRDLQSELAQVYKGGTSPTDQGLKQAMGILESNWDLDRLKAAVVLTRKNLTIRLNSITQTQIMGTSSTTFAPPAPTGNVKVWNPQTGRFE